MLKDSAGCIRNRRESGKQIEYEIILNAFFYSPKSVVKCRQTKDQAFLYNIFDPIIV